MTATPLAPTALPRTRTSLAGTIVRGGDRHGDLDLRADVVVIGSGAGGAVAARVLAEAGRDVVVVEEGPHISAREHGDMRPTQSLRHVWRDGGMSFAVGLGDTPIINVTMGRVVGGSSMVTGGVCLRTPDHVHEHWVAGRGLTTLGPREMEPHYDVVERWTGVQEVPVAMRSRGVALFGEGLQRAYGKDASLESLRRNTHDCQGLGRCNFGCPHEAKLSVDLSVLPQSLARGTTVVADALVERIRLKGRTATGVEGRLGSGHRFVVHADQVVLAGGAWHNPLLLRRSGIRQRDLGKHMTLHPSFRTMARFAEPVRGWEGALQSAYSPSFMRDGLTLVALFVPPGVVAGAMPGIGPEHLRRAGDLQNIAMFGCLLHDEGGGRVWPGPGREPIVSYRMAQGDRARLPGAVKKMAEIFFAAGALEVFTPVLGLGALTPERMRAIDFDRLPGRRYECTSQHPLGTCRMGPDPRSSVVDPNGRVWDTNGLWVADGSIVPTSLGVNPQVTVMAMAHRVASGIVAGT